MRRGFLLLIFIYPLICSAQELTGIWRGYFYEVLEDRKLPGKPILSTGDRYKFEVQINHNGKKIQGVTYSYLQKQFYGKAAMVGSFSAKTQNVLIQETNMLEMKSLSMESACVMTLLVKHTTIGEEETLEGTYFSMNTADSSNCGRGKVFLRRVLTSDFKEEPFLQNKKKELNNKPPQTAKDTISIKMKPAPQPIILSQTKPILTDSIVIAKPKLKAPLPFSSSYNQRDNELVQNIRLPAGKVQVKIYDNGTIDNDTVTVVLDLKKIISRAKLTEKPLIFNFQLSSEEPDHEVIMIADNLGLYPPNTSLMIVESGNQRFEVRISSSDKKNAVVRFQLSPENF